MSSDLFFLGTADVLGGSPLADDLTENGTGATS